MFESDLNKRGGGKNGATIRVTSEAIIESGLQPLARYGTHQETISRRPEQIYTPSDTRLEWPKEGLLFELDSNECSGDIIEVMLGALGKIWHLPGDYEWETGTSVSSI